MPVESIDVESGCLTVAQLKALIADWPDEDAMGEPTQVWISTGWCLSSPVIEAGPLNLRVKDDGTRTADIILSSALWQSPEDRCPHCGR